ncbi:MAG: hypothetical protein U0X20_10190 [Caldilineaceae bacterium]
MNNKQAAANLALWAHIRRRIERRHNYGRQYVDCEGQYAYVLAIVALTRLQVIGQVTSFSAIKK